MDSDETAIKMATLLQNKWYKLRHTDTLISINPKGGHEQELLHLVNSPTTKGSVKRSFNKVKLELLERALTDGNFDADIFTDSTLPQLTMSLFAKGTITKQQTISILERYQILNDYSIQMTYPLFKPDGETFTAEAEQFILPMLSYQNKILKPLSTEQINDFRWLVASLPKSEQFFYTTSVNTRYGRRPEGNLQGALINLSAAYKTDTSMLHLSCGAKDALGLARFGEKRYVPAISRFGIQTLDNIEESVRQSVRYAALSYPETPSFKQGLHRYFFVNDYEATAHDTYHSNVMSTMPPDIRQALLHLVDVIRPMMSEKWSLELWDYVDADFKHAFRTHQQSSTDELTTQQTTELFCTLLLQGRGRSSHFSKGGFLARMDKPADDSDDSNPSSHWDLTIQGAMVYLDMITNPKWQEMRIDSRYLIPPFHDHFQLINTIYSDIKDNKKEVQWLKCLLYTQLSATDRDRVFPMIAKLIDDDTEILSKLELQKPSRYGTLAVNNTTRPKNSLHLTYLDDLVSLQTVHSLFRAKYQSDFENSSNRYPETLEEIEQYHAFRTVGNNHQQAFRKLAEEMFKVNPTNANWCLSHPIIARCAALPFIGFLFQLYIDRQVQNQIAMNKEALTRRITRHDDTTSDPYSYQVIEASIENKLPHYPSQTEKPHLTTHKKSGSEKSIPVANLPTSTSNDKGNSDKNDEDHHSITYN